MTDTTTPAAPAAAPTTPGYKTTEFWLTAASSLLLLLNKSGALGHLQIPTDTVMAVLGMVATYVGSRTVVKATS